MSNLAAKKPEPSIFEEVEVEVEVERGGKFGMDIRGNSNRVYIQRKKNSKSMGVGVKA